MRETRLKIKKFIAFTLAEIIIVLGIVGIVAEMTIPGLVQSYQETQMVTGLLTFHSTLQQAILMWKQEVGCYQDTGSCLVAQFTDVSAAPSDITTYNAFNNSIGKYMKISQKVNHSNNEDWLADENSYHNYYGGVVNGALRKDQTAMGGLFLMNNGTIFALRAEFPSAIEVWVDVNGKKPPNRIGKDFYRLVIGKIGTQKNNDINYSFVSGDSSLPADSAYGLCGCWGPCNPNETNPTGNAAMPTSYVILNQKLPDFKALSQSIGGFLP